MAICLMVDNPDESADEFAKVMEHLGTSGPVPPTGASFLVAGPVNGAWRVISVWDSPKSMQQFFGERLAPAYRAAGLPLESAKQSTFRGPHARGAAALNPLMPTPDATSVRLLRDASTILTRIST
ncbi:MAG: hypothetical protein H0U86_11155 [Chloroflexi bacterium]|nr:hypothetical protein [Chloroflexota bacterium]